MLKNTLFSFFSRCEDVYLHSKQHRNEADLILYLYIYFWLLKRKFIKQMRTENAVNLLNFNGLRIFLRFMDRTKFAISFQHSKMFSKVLHWICYFNTN